ncbi:integrase core domain-containing protein, partial [Acidobacteriota bacterium]
PERGGLTWREFLSRHADVLLCADLFTKEIWTSCGLQRAFVLVVMHVRSRTILLAEATFSPHAGWMAQQVRNVLWECGDLGVRPCFLIHDRDKCFCADFDATLRSAGVKPVHTPYHAPNANAFAERWIRSIRVECLNHLVLIGLESLRRVATLYCRHFNDSRPHQGLANRVPRDVRTSVPAPEAIFGPVGEVHCEESLGGLLKSYRRAA